jgi:hypothetical protein
MLGTHIIFVFCPASDGQRNMFEMWLLRHKNDKGAYRIVHHIDETCICIFQE